MKYKFILCILAFAFPIASAMAGTAVDGSDAVSVDAGTEASAATDPSMAYRCNGCTAAQAASVAASKGLGQHYVYDLDRNKLYTMYCEPGSPLLCYEIGTSLAAQTVFNDYRSAYNSNGKSESFVISVPVNLPSGRIPGRDGLPMDNGTINAWGTITTNNYNLQVIRYLSDPSHYSGFYATLVKALDSIGGNPVVKFDKMSAVFDVTFSDGSRRTYKYNKDLGRFEAVPGTGIDSHDNALPDAANPTPINQTAYIFTGVPNFNSYDYRNISWYFNTRPIDGGCVVTRWDGGTLTCVRPH